MSLEWIFAAEAPLPIGLAQESLACVSDELGDSRISAAENLLGREMSRNIAKKVGAYELEEELARRLELEGLSLGQAGEFLALSPQSWGRYPEARTWDAFISHIELSGAELLGLRLTAAQRESFLKFLSRNRVNPEATAHTVIELARHFFFGEPLNVVVRYTGPRFAQA